MVQMLVDGNRSHPSEGAPPKQTYHQTFGLVRRDSKDQGHVFKN